MQIEEELDNLFESILRLCKSNDENNIVDAKKLDLFRPCPDESYITFALQLSEHWRKINSRNIVLIQLIENIELLLEQEEEIAEEIPDYNYTLF